MTCKTCAAVRRALLARMAKFQQRRDALRANAKVLREHGGGSTPPFRNIAPELRGDRPPRPNPTEPPR